MKTSLIIVPDEFDSEMVKIYCAAIEEYKKIRTSEYRKTAYRIFVCLNFSDKEKQKLVIDALDKYFGESFHEEKRTSIV